MSRVTSYTSSYYCIPNAGSAHCCGTRVPETATMVGVGEGAGEEEEEEEEEEVG
jgi:hypothetical protein